MKRIAWTLLTTILAASLAMAAEKPTGSGAPAAKPSAPTTPAAQPETKAPAAPGAEKTIPPPPPIYRYPIKLLGFKNTVNCALKDVVVVDVTVGRAGFSTDGKSRLWKLTATFKNPTEERKSPTAALVLYQGDTILGGITMLDGRYTIEPNQKVVQEQKVELPKTENPDGFGVTERLPWLRTTPGMRPTPAFARPPANTPQSGLFAQPPGRPGMPGGPGMMRPGERPGGPPGDRRGDGRRWWGRGRD